MRICSFVSCLTLVFRHPTRAQEQPQGVIRVGVNLVLLDATVKNKTGQIMADLKKEDFEVREDGAVAKTGGVQPGRIADQCGAGAGFERFDRPFSWDHCETRRIPRWRRSSRMDEAALFTFSTEAQLRVPFTKDKQEIAKQINSFQAGGATNINDGIFLASQYLLKLPPKGRRVIILISDDVGTDAGGQGTRDIVTETIAADAVLYNLKIPGYNPPQTLMYASMVPGLVNIRKVMDATGGELFEVKDVAHLDAEFRALIQRIKTRYTLGYYTNASAALGKPHKLDVRLASSFGKKGKDYVVLSKNGFYVH